MTWNVTNLTSHACRLSLYASPNTTIAVRWCTDLQQLTTANDNLPPPSPRLHDLPHDLLKIYYEIPRPTTCSGVTFLLGPLQQFCKPPPPPFTNPPLRYNFLSYSSRRSSVFVVLFLRIIINCMIKYFSLSSNLIFKVYQFKTPIFNSLNSLQIIFNITVKLFKTITDYIKLPNRPT